MPIRTVIADGCGEGIEAGVHKKPDLPSGLVVYTEPLRTKIGTSVPAISPVFGVSAAVDAQFSGTPDGIHNGTDSALYTASAISGTWTFDSTTQANSGTKSIDASATVNNDEALLTRASTISTGAFTAVTGFIYLTSFPSQGTKDIELRLRLAGADINGSVGLANFIDTGSFNVWQKFTISISDFGAAVSDVDEVVIKTVDIGGGQAPNYFIDDLQFEETGGATFTVTPPQGTVYTATNLSIQFAATTTDTTSTWNEIATLTLAAGIFLRSTIGGEPLVAIPAFTHLDLMAVPGFVSVWEGNGTTASVIYNIKFDDPLRLDSRNADSFEMIISDDFSSLLEFRLFTRGFTETF